MPTYTAESFYRAKIKSWITKTQTTPFTIKLSKLPNASTWLLTISPNTEYEEIVEWDNKNAGNSTVDIIKRWINPTSTLLTVAGTDYNNPTYQQIHTQNDEIRWDINHIHVNQAIGNTTLATAGAVGIVRLSTAPVDALDPIVVGNNDPRLSAKETDILLVDFWWQTGTVVWTVYDGAFRDTLIDYVDWNKEQLFTSQNMCSGLAGTVNAKITSRRTPWITITWRDLTLPVWKTLSVSAFINTANAQLRILPSGWSYRYLKNPNTLTAAAPDTTLTNSWVTPLTVKFQFQCATAWQTPIYGFIATIY